MSVYQIADGFDNEAGFTTVDPQPACEGLLYPSRRLMIDGTPIDKGLPFVVWRYKGSPTALPADVYAGLLTLFGLTGSTIYNDVTIKTMIDPARTTWTNYNGRIIRPERVQYENGFYRNIDFLIIGLTAT